MVIIGNKILNMLNLVSTTKAASINHARINIIIAVLCLDILFLHLIKEPLVGLEPTSIQITVLYLEDRADTEAET